MTKSQLYGEVTWLNTRWLMKPVWTEIPENLERTLIFCNKDEVSLPFPLKKQTRWRTQTWGDFQKKTDFSSSLPRVFVVVFFALSSKGTLFIRDRKWALHPAAGQHHAAACDSRDLSLLLQALFTFSISYFPKLISGLPSSTFPFEGPATLHISGPDW